MSAPAACAERRHQTNQAPFPTYTVPPGQIPAPKAASARPSQAAGDALDGLEAVDKLLDDLALLILRDAELLLDVLHLLHEEVALLLLCELLLNAATDVALQLQQLELLLHDRQRLEHAARHAALHEEVLEVVRRAVHQRHRKVCEAREVLHTPTQAVSCGPVAGAAHRRPRAERWGCCSQAGACTSLVVGLA